MINMWLFVSLLSLLFLLLGALLLLLFGEGIRHQALLNLRVNSLARLVFEVLGHQDRLLQGLNAKLAIVLGEPLLDGFNLMYLLLPQLVLHGPRGHR